MRKQQTEKAHSLVSSITFFSPLLGTTSLTPKRHDKSLIKLDVDIEHMFTLPFRRGPFKPSLVYPGR